MTTAAAAPVPTNQQIEHEVRELEKQNATFGPRLRADEEKLATLTGEQSRVAEAIVKGEEKPARAAQLKAEIEELQVRVSGARSIIAKNNAALAPLCQEIGRRQAEAERSARLKAFQDLINAGRAKAQEAVDQLLAVATGPLAQFDEIRERLEREFGDLDRPTGEQSNEAQARLQAAMRDSGLRAANGLVSELLDVDGVLLAIRQPRFNDWRRGVNVPICSLRPPRIQ